MIFAPCSANWVQWHQPHHVWSLRPSSFVATLIFSYLWRSSASAKISHRHPEACAVATESSGSSMARIPTSGCWRRHRVYTSVHLYWLRMWSVRERSSVPTAQQNVDFPCFKVSSLLIISRKLIHNILATIFFQFFQTTRQINCGAEVIKFTCQKKNCNPVAQKMTKMLSWISCSNW